VGYIGGKLDVSASGRVAPYCPTLSLKL